jgi:hypothetical protein
VLPVIDARTRGSRTGGRGRRRLLWGVAAVVGVLAVAAGVAYLVLRDPARPVTVDEARERFRDGGEAAPAGGGDAPPAGVYVYATTGYEQVDALTGSRHDYPEETTGTLTAAEGGCLRWRWEPLRQRWDEELLCPADGGAWARPETALFHSFFNQDETRAYECTGDPYVPPPDAEPGTTFAWTCDSPGSEHSGDSHEDGTGEVVGVESVEVDGVERDALRVHYETAVSGDSTGGGELEVWYSLDRWPLVLRQVREGGNASETVIGTVNYEEAYELMLTAWDPLR